MAHEAIVPHSEAATLTESQEEQLGCTSWSTQKKIIYGRVIYLRLGSFLHQMYKKLKKITTHPRYIPRNLKIGLEKKRNMNL